jgi:hypothetical protein
MDSASRSRAITLPFSSSYSSIGFPVQRAIVSVVSCLEAYDGARDADPRADSAAARAGQHKMAAAIVPAHQIDPLLNPPWVGLLNAWRGGFFAPGFDCVDPARNEIVTGSKGRQGVGPSLAQLPKHGKRPRVTISLNAASPGDIPFACITAAVISAEVSGLDAIRRASCVRRDSSLRAK